MNRVWIGLICLLFVMTAPMTAAALSFDSPEKRGAALVIGSSYDPSPSFGFAQFSLMALYDYEQIFAHRAPDALRFKLEGNIGLTDDSNPRLLMSANFLALYYLKALKTDRLKPFVEAGAGIVYSDFRVEDQGLRINFNPQAGLGAEWHGVGGHTYYGAMRAWHLSNGGLHRDNRGINAVTLQLGVHF